MRPEGAGESRIVFDPFCADDLESVRRDLHEVVDAFCAALDAKHSYTSGHSDRVAELSAGLAAALGCPEEECRFVHVAAHLHDLGKIGVRDAVLLKEGLLDEAEFAEMRRHPQLGADILSRVGTLRPYAEAVLHHHERWDGSGYPAGLAGIAIPRCSRIIAVADAYDAMSSDRSYRRRLSPGEVVRELEAGRGRQFDPDILDAFLQVVIPEALVV